MHLAVLGDLHGDFEALDRLMALEPGVAAWLSVGDVASDTGQYPAPSRPVYFIKGNNEDFDLVARLAAGEMVSPHLHLLPNGKALDIESPGSDPASGPRNPIVRVAGLGGTFAPKWYETAPGDLPAARASSRRSAGAGKADDKRRHFVRAEVEACRALRGVDVFLSHEAPRPYWVGAGGRRNDAGKTAINEVLAAMRPRLHVFGHHHTFSDRLAEGIRSIGLPLAAEGYLLVETEGWSWRMKAPE